MAWKFSKPSTSRPPELYGGSSSAAPDAAQLPAVQQHGQSAALATPELASCASSGRAWRLWAARHSQEEAGPLGAQPLPWMLELATCSRQLTRL